MNKQDCRALVVVPGKFQLAVRPHCCFLFPNNDPATVIKETQRMAEQFERSQQRFGVKFSKKTDSKTVEVTNVEAVSGVQTKLAGSSGENTTFISGKIAQNPLAKKTYGEQHGSKDWRRFPWSSNNVTESGGSYVCSAKSKIVSECTA